VADAEVNASINGIKNAVFIAGEAEKVLTSDFTAEHGRPDIIITDPPRNGMHEKVVRAIRDAGPAKIVYVSCNPATQARDLALLNDLYTLEVCQPVDMFPHTQHVENIALLRRRSP
jgi:23S rRNA (uracil1939-C5)-methyltransferase